MWVGLHMGASGTRQMASSGIFRWVFFFHCDKKNHVHGVVALLHRGAPKQCRSSESLEVDEYLGAIELLHAMRFGLEDVEMFLFKPEHTVLLNMIGLHYCIDCLRVPAICVLEALYRSKISER